MIVSHIAALIAVLGTAIIYGTDAFSALVMRPALARVNDVSLLSVMGNVHRYGDKRLPAPGIIGVLGSGIACVFALVSGQYVEAALTGVAFILLVIWLALYARISAPINRVLTAAVDARDISVDARSNQRDWDRIITLRAVLQGVAVAALCVSLFA